ncbi:hypothetical protein PRIPAC_70608, partial [Pristionchus pacificus]
RAPASFKESPLLIGVSGKRIDEASTSIANSSALIVETIPLIDPTEVEKSGQACASSSFFAFGTVAVAESNGRIDEEAAAEASSTSRSSSTMSTSSIALIAAKTIGILPEVDAIETSSNKHRDYWSGIRDNPDACPLCGERYRGSSARRTHYLRHHYDVYFDIISHREDSFVCRILGSTSDSNVQFVFRKVEYETFLKLKDRPATRICVNCRGTSSESRLHEGPIGILTHMAKHHPAALHNLKEEYAARGIVVNNAELHKHLITRKRQIKEK